MASIFSKLTAQLQRYTQLAHADENGSRNRAPSGSAQAEAHRGVPVFAVPLLIAAVFAVSSAATVFSLMPEVPAITLAAWRLQLTSVLLGLGAAHQWRGLSADDRARALGSAAWLAGSGACLAVHFGAWVWGLQHTSLTHSLLMVSATPLLLAALALATGSPISRGEVGGALLGLAGAVVLSVGATGGREAQAGLAGDLASLLASAVMVGYLSVGRRLRQWMPIFIYAFPVTGSAALALTLGGLALEPVTLLGSGSHGSLGWLTSAHYAPWVLYLALGPGIVGHTGFNTLLRYLSPLTVALAFQMEPLVGSVIGWAAGVMSPPGALTYGGGALVVVATIFVTIASADRERQEEAGKATAAKQELVPAASWESEDCGAAGGLGGPGRGTAGQEDEEAQRLLVARGSPS